MAKPAREKLWGKKENKAFAYTKRACVAEQSSEKPGRARGRSCQPQRLGPGKVFRARAHGTVATAPSTTKPSSCVVRPPSNIMELTLGFGHRIGPKRETSYTRIRRCEWVLTMIERNRKPWEVVFAGVGKGEKRADFLVARVFQHWARGLAVRCPYPENNMAIVLSTPKLSQTSRADGWWEKTKPQEEPEEPLKVRLPTCRLAPHGEVNCCCSGKIEIAKTQFASVGAE